MEALPPGQGPVDAARGHQRGPLGHRHAPQKRHRPAHRRALAVPRRARGSARRALPRRGAVPPRPHRRRQPARQHHEARGAGEGVLPRPHPRGRRGALRGGEAAPRLGEACRWGDASAPADARGVAAPRADRHLVSADRRHPAPHPHHQPPRQPAAIRECLEAVFPAIPYCVELIGGAFLEGLPSGPAVFRPKKWRSTSCAEPPPPSQGPPRRPRLWRGRRLRTQRRAP